MISKSKNLGRLGPHDTHFIDLLLAARSFWIPHIRWIGNMAAGCNARILMVQNRRLVSWWLNQPIWKICASQIGSFPQLGVKITNYLKPPRRDWNRTDRLNDFFCSNGPPSKKETFIANRNPTKNTCDFEDSGVLKCRSSFRIGKWSGKIHRLKRAFAQVNAMDSGQMESYFTHLDFPWNLARIVPPYFKPQTIFRWAFSRVFRSL